jgi:hypothetical protein
MFDRRAKACTALALFVIALAACGAPEGDGDASDGRSLRDGSAEASDGPSLGEGGDDVEPPADGGDLDASGDDVVADIDADGTDADGMDAARTDGARMDAARTDAARTDAARDAGTDAALHCTAPRVDCSGVCADTHTDPHHCGSCGHACPSGDVCMNGTCSLSATCPPVVFPSVTIQSIPVASMTALYRSIASGTCYPVPQCFIDLDRLEDPATGRSLDVHVNLSPHFTLYEFVASELAGGYTHYALLSPSLVSHLESLRAQEGGHGITIASGYRSPQHQMATCRSICAGGASCCPSAPHPCGCRSEHEWGRAADLAIPSSEYTAYGNDAHAVHMPDCLLEAGSFHVDVSPCPLGCPYRF